MGFWSITMYMIDGGWWFVPNALNKFHGSPRDNPRPNADGSLTLSSKRIPGQGQGSQLAACSERRLSADDADVLAQGYITLDH